MTGSKQRKTKKHPSCYRLSMALMSLITIGFIVFVTAGCSHSISSKPHNEKNDLIDRFQLDVKTGKVDDLESILKPESSNMTITRKNIEDLIDYSKKHPDYLTQLVQILKKQKQLRNKIDLNLKKSSSSVNPETMPKSSPLKKSVDLSVLSKGDFNYAHFKGQPYHIYVQPHQLDIHFNQENAILLINGKTYHPGPNTDDFYLDNLPPDIYKIEVEQKFAHTTLADQKTVSLYGNKINHEQSAFLALKENKIKIFSSQRNVAILMNGKKLGVNAAVTDPTSIQPSPYYGPFPVDGSVTLQGEKQYPWGINKSKRYVVSDNSVVMDLEPSPFYSEKTKNQIVTTINQFTKERMQALSKKDPGALTVTTGSAKKRIEKEIQAAKSQGEQWNGKVLGTKIDFDMTWLKQVGPNQYNYKILVQIQSKMGKSKGTLYHQQLKDQKEGDYITLTFDTKSKRWIVTKVESAPFQGGDRSFMVNSSF